jgi:hypothetical protein
MCVGPSGLAVYPDDSVFHMPVVFITEICDGARFAPVSVTFFSISART